MENQIDPFIEWIVWAHLDSQNDLELILLKGHLLLESVIDITLSRNKISNQKNYSFYRKIKELGKIEFSDSERKKNIILFLSELNKLRNKLAHDFEFEIKNGDLELLATKILNNLKGRKFAKYTYRIKIVHSFSVLAKNILEINNEKTTVTKYLN